MVFEIKPIVTIVGVGILLINTLSPSETPSYKCSINLDSLERNLDSTLISQSIILGSKAIIKDSTCKVLTQTVTVLKVENKELKHDIKDLKVLATKVPDTIVKTVFIKKGIFGKEDTINN
jgi:hypothetical protein